MFNHQGVSKTTNPPRRRNPNSDNERSPPTPPSGMKPRAMSASAGSPRPLSGKSSNRPSRAISARQSTQEFQQTTPTPDETPQSPQDMQAEQDTPIVEAEAIRVNVPTPDNMEDVIDD